MLENPARRPALPDSVILLTDASLCLTRPRSSGYRRKNRLRVVFCHQAGGTIGSLFPLNHHQGYDGYGCGVYTLDLWEGNGTKA